MIYTNTMGLPSVLLSAARNFDLRYMSSHDNTTEQTLPTISVTQLIDSPTIKRLRDAHNNEVSVDIADTIWRLLGSAVHNILEMADNTYLKELRISHNFCDKMQINGQLDLFDYKTATLTDWKVTSKYKVRDGCPHEYINQINVLAYLVNKELTLPVEHLQIVCILRNFNKSDAVKADMPARNIITFDVPKWSDVEVTAYINSRVDKHLALVPDRCTLSERWKDPDKYAIVKDSVSKAHKLCDTEDEAISFLATMKTPGYKVRRRVSPDKRCIENYCGVNSFCEYYINNISNILS